MVDEIEPRRDRPADRPLTDVRAFLFVERETQTMAASFNKITQAIKLYAAAMALVKAAEMADDLRLLIDELGWERPAVAGQSWGGNVAAGSPAALRTLHPSYCFPFLRTSERQSLASRKTYCALCLCAGTSLVSNIHAAQATILYNGPSAGIIAFSSNASSGT